MEYLNVEPHFNERRDLINHLKATSNSSISDHDLITLTLFYNQYIHYCLVCIVCLHYCWHMWLEREEA